MDRLYILRDLDEFKKRYVKNRIKNGNYNIDSNVNIVVRCFGDLEKEKYSHEFIYLNNDNYKETLENYAGMYKILDDSSSFQEFCRPNCAFSIDNIKKGDILEIFKISPSITECLDDNYDSLICLLKQYYWRLNELLPYLALDNTYMAYKDDDYLSWLYQIDIKSLEEMRKMYFYDKSFVPYYYIAKFSEMNLLQFEYRTTPYVIGLQFELEGTNVRQISNDEIDRLKHRQNKSKIKASSIYTK